MSTNEDMKSRWMKSWRSVSLLPLMVAFLLLIGISGVASADEMVTNGIYNGSTNWALTTATYNAGNTATADGSGSVEVYAIGRKIGASGTATQAVNIPAGSVISAASSVIAYGMEAYTLAVPNITPTITIDLEYANTSTVTVFNGTVTANSPWGAISNTATGFPLTLADNVTNIIVTLATASGNNASATSTVSADNLSITYSAPVPSNAYGTMTSMAGPLTADLSQQTVATVPVTLTLGGASVSSYTVNLSGTVTSGDVTGVYVTDGVNTWSSIGTYGSGSSVVCTGANAIPGATLSIKVTLAAAADAKTVAVTLNTDSNAASTLPKGPSNALAINGPSNSYGTISSMAGPLTADLSQQTVATVPVSLALGGKTVSSYTVNLSGTVTAGDVAGVYVTDGTNTWSATGSYGNGSSVVCSGANAIPGATLSIKVTLNLTADTKTVAVTLNTDSNAASSLPKGPSTALTIAAPSGPASTINSCSGCHGYPAPLVDSGTRDPATGTFVGDHAKHNYDCSTCHGTLPGAYGHRDGNINISSGTIGLNNGTYTKGATVAQSNAPSPGSCDSVNCHGNNNTGTWGGAGYASCATSTCHGFPPNTNAHSKHYTSKGWSTGTYTNCVACHPDDFTAHADRTDGVVELANLTPSGAGATITCASISNTGCHNTKSTPQWGSTGITCSSCHVIGGGAAGDPTTGLHVTTNLLAHDNQFKATPGEVLPGTATCISCHSATTTLTSSLHFNGTVENSAVATYTWNLTNIPVTGYVRASDACAATCHTDSGTWNRKWSGAKTNDVVWSYTDDAATAGVCGNCHGSFATGWNIVGATDHVNPSAVNDNNPGTADNPDTLATSKTNHGECSKCHGWGVTAYSTGSKHVNNTLEMNSALDITPGDGDCTTNCHSGQALTMNAASGWTDGTVVGDGVACGDCHNGGVTPSFTSGAHDSHGAGIAQLVDGGAACVPCHGNNGGAGFLTSLAGTHGIGNAVNWATNLVYSQAATRGNIDGTCTGTAGCHVATTNILWSEAQTNCNQCHYSTTDTANWGWTGTAGNISMISSTQYTAVGHGQATINGAAANKACTDCHDIAIAHDQTATLTGTNPFRLKASFTCNSIVAGCHTITGLLGTHDQATAGAKYTWPFAAKCVDCHDPHGDGSNLAMIHSDLADKGSAANWVRNTPDAGIETMVFTNTTGILADSYAEPSTTFDGICQECHTLTTSMKDNTIANGANHTATNGCMSCHAHGEGFKAAGCNGCHGGDNATIGNKNFWPGGVGAAYPDRTGEHNVHIQKLATKLGYPFNDTITDQQQKTMCAYCHNYTTEPGESGHDAGGAPADVASFNPLWSVMTGSYPSTADDGTYTPGNGTNGSCATVDCHNNVTTPVTQEWYDGGTSNCVMCHTKATSGSNPSSGLHYGGTAPTVSGVWHDNSLNGNANDCLPCHVIPAYSAAGTHINGAFTGNSTIAGDRTALGLTFSTTNGYTQTADNVGSCVGTWVSGCHPGGDAGTWARKWNSGIHYGTLVSMTPCAGCHGGFGTNDWTFGTVANTTDGSVEHNRNWDTPQDGVAEVIGNHSNGTDKKCNSCHVYGDGDYVWGTHHRNNQITMNSTAGYSSTTWNCTSSCHANNTSHNLEDSGWTPGTLAGPALDCTGCHSTIYNGGAGTHIDADGPGTAFIPGTTAGTILCQACHTQHAQASDTTAANKIIISTVGIGTMTDSGGTALYGTHGNKIWLGGTATSSATYTTTINATTEAQMCWGCHDKVTADRYTLSGVNVTFTAPATIAATGIGTKFAVGRWITVFGSSNAVNNRTFKVATSTANSITVTIPALSANLVSVGAAAGVTIVSPVSEWQVNQNTATGDLDYDYGMLFTDTTIPGTRTSNWTSGVWRSGKGLNNTLTTNPFWYKRGAIQSTHTANVGGTFTAAITAGNSLGYNRTETVDAVGNIRCSYCHDVHGTHDGVKGDVAGKPYLRGTWVGNLYAEDGAPRFNMTTFTNQAAAATPASPSTLGIVPRASSDPNNTGLTGVLKVGGFWIDQNSNNPTSSITGANNLAKATSSSGLCEQCHGTDKNGTWTAAELGSLDQVTETGLWVSGYNGHANVVLGASGGVAGTVPTAGGAEIRGRNIMNRTLRGSATITGTTSTANPKYLVDMGLSTQTNSGYSYRSASGGGNGYGWVPRVGQTAELDVVAGRAYAFRHFAWNNVDYNSGSARNFVIASGTLKLVVTNPTAATSETAHDAQLNYHTFTCSKCHNPHASRLPKLMITNCLDTNHNTWEDKATGFVGDALPGAYAGLRHSQWASAQNCHRLDARAVLATGQVTTLGPGWNKATPWLEDTTPNGTLTSDLP